MESSNLYLGTHQPHWLAFSDMPLFVIQIVWIWTKRRDAMPIAGLILWLMLQPPQSDGILCVGDCSHFLQEGYAKSHSTYIGNACAIDSDWPKNIIVPLEDDPPNYMATCGRMKCEKDGGYWIGANAWGECQVHGR
jgi:hypothetical protein